MTNKRKKKVIAFFVGSLQHGGAERVIVNLANFWVNTGQKVIIITLSNTESFYKLDDRIEHLKLGLIENSEGSIWKGLRGNLIRIYQLRKTLKENRVDSLISFITDANIISILATLYTKIKVVVSDRAAPQSEKLFINPIKLKVKKLLYPFADYVVVQTYGAAAFYKWLDNDNVKIINNPITNFSTDTLNLKREKVILGVGRLVEEKNFFLLIEAFSRFKLTDWKLVILGEGKERPKLEMMIEKYNLNDSVLLKGNTKNVAEWYQKASIFVLSSKYEGYPNALIEAMSMGLAVISTDCAFGPTEIIEQNKNGIIINNNNIEQLVEALSKLIYNEELRKSLGDEATAIKYKLNIERIASQWSELL